MDFLNLLGKINESKSFALTVCISILGGVILVCVLALIIKKLHLNKKYEADEKFVKEYRANLKKKEKEKETNKKSASIEEGF